MLFGPLHTRKKSLVHGISSGFLRPPPRVLISFTYIVRFSLVDRYWLLLAYEKSISFWAIIIIQSECRSHSPAIVYGLILKRFCIYPILMIAIIDIPYTIIVETSRSSCDCTIKALVKDSLDYIRLD